MKATLPTEKEYAAMKAVQTKTEQEIKRLGYQKNALESNIANLQAKIGSTQALLETAKKALASREEDVARLKESLTDYKATQDKLAKTETALTEAKDETRLIVKNAAEAEASLKQEIKKNVELLLQQREENTKAKYTIRDLTEVRAKQEAEIGSLKKQLAKALSEEEKILLKKRIADLTADMKKMADASEDELVKELANKNYALNDILSEQLSYKEEMRKLNRSIEAYRIQAIRQKEIADKAEEAAKVASYDARRSRAELKMLRADVEDGVVSAPTSQIAGVRKRSTSAVTVSGTETAAATARDNNLTNKLFDKVKTAQEKAAKTDVKETPVSETVKTIPEKPAEPTVVSATVPDAAPAVKQEASDKEYKDAMEQGAASEKNGDLGMALWHYWRAADMGNRPEPYFALARLHLKRKERESALKAYEKAILYGGRRDTEFEKDIKTK